MSTVQVQNINHTNGTSAITIDSVGNVNIPGHVVQTVTQNFTTSVSTTSTSFVATAVSVSITPTSASNKILILGSVPMFAQGITAGGHAVFSLFRGGVASGTNLGDVTFGTGQLYSTSGDNIAMLSLNHIDSPATTSSVTYEIGIKRQNPSAIATAQLAVNAEVYNLTVMEIAQ